MGEFGFPLRVLAPRLGSFLTFASPGGDRVAPGLIDPETLDTVYRYHRIGPGTRVFGIIGNPILHSRSPHIHNPGYDRLGIDAVYVPFHADSAAAFLPVMRKLEVGGLSVTVPFKEEIIPLCGWTEEAVRAIGACNTVTPGPEGLRGCNTDAEGFLAPLRKLYGGGGAGFLGGLRAAVIGAGGSARSAVYALAREGARVLVLNRTPERARRLTEDIAGSLGLADGVLLWAELDDAGHRERENYPDLLVNTTTMGMHPWEDLDPLEGRSLAGTGTVYDIVYSPRDTLLLRRAAGAGCRTIHGEEMLLSQAYRQFHLYTGREYPGQFTEV
jgi:3-dehydroquinate dehydratase/shikimate dehydrogenase